ncbi:alpha/beta hydrolase [Humibacter sp.]|jgi:pimeloyl-ACP methyl ester carboxylesterase|uniref:alpha/beta fold hydrolase n=1 Tax=Humibacter sp. TaxID=1940291 RepID=UPI002C464802|nr:alpha/beta hydrolase [Humibacter sp.]HVX07272.1 alpha/beta hydrolase [Humibacter sp.]
MHTFLIPGLWLDASSWDAITPAVEAAGHHAHPVTPPGLEADDADRSGITLDTHIDNIVRLIDEVPGDEKVALVAHSGGALVAFGAIDRRPDRVDRVVYVDSWPGGEGSIVNDEVPHDDADMPFPGWDAFDEGDVRDITPELGKEIAAHTHPSPSHAAIDPLHLSDERRLEVPATIIISTMPAEQLDDLVEQGVGWLGDTPRLSSLHIAGLPTGHWPQFTKPQELSELIVDALTE